MPRSALTEALQDLVAISQTIWLPFEDSDVAPPNPLGLL